jgi:(1->4)-alpha-D-glucan 1-alpha-D-glucosylmutase
LLKLTSPGVPDIYQGNETWDFSLVDPDNRRPVDYKLRAEMLSCLSTKSPEELLQNWPDGRIKVFLTQRALRFRNEQVELFRSGNYLPLRATGSFADCCLCFARQLDQRSIIVIVPRLSSRIGFPPIGEHWRDTVVELPENVSLHRGHEIFTGRELSIQNRQIRVSDAMSILPFAIITNL